MKERARLAVEYGVEASAGRGGWLADREALEVLEDEVAHLRQCIARMPNVTPGSPQQAFIGAMAACVPYPLLACWLVDPFPTSPVI